MFNINFILIKFKVECVYVVMQDLLTKEKGYLVHGQISQLQLLITYFTKIYVALYH